MELFSKNKKHEQIEKLISNFGGVKYSLIIDTIEIDESEKMIRFYIFNNLKKEELLITSSWNNLKQENLNDEAFEKLELEFYQQVLLLKPESPIKCGNL